MLNLDFMLGLQNLYHYNLMVDILYNKQERFCAIHFVLDMYELYLKIELISLNYHFLKSSMRLWGLWCIYPYIFHILNKINMLKKVQSNI